MLGQGTSIIILKELELSVVSSALEVALNLLTFCI